MLKKIGCFILFFLLSFAISNCIAGNLNFFENYKKDFVANGGFPINKNKESQNILLSAPYDSIFIYSNKKDFLGLVKPDRRNKESSIITTGFVVHKRKNSDGTIRGDLNQNLFPPKVIFFTGDTTLRGQLSLDCVKPSFKIKNSDLDINYKLKGFCGASYGVEETMFGDLVQDMGSSLLNNYFVFFKQQYYRKVFVNGKLYGLYIEVPAFNKNYLNDTSVIDPKKKQNCIFKISKFVLPSNKPESSVTSRLEYKGEPNKKDIDEVVETKYGNEDICFEKKKKLLDVINKKGVSFEEIEELVNPESILMRGLVLRHTNNHISYTHNYLLVENNGKLSAGFWDIEGFRGCRNQNLNKYFNKGNYKYNILFSKVLEWYLKNDLQKVKDFEKKITDHICNYDRYLYFKNLNLKYVIADRFLRSIGHISPMFIETVANQKKTLKFDSIKIYQNKINFKEYFDKHYHLFDKAFGFK